MSLLLPLICSPLSQSRKRSKVNPLQTTSLKWTSDTSTEHDLLHSMMQSDSMTV